MSRTGVNFRTRWGRNEIIIRRVESITVEVRRSTSPVFRISVQVEKRNRV